MGAQPPRVIPHQLLHREPTSALHKPALNLPHIQRRVQRRPDIMHNIRAQNAVLTGQRINNDLRQSRPIGTVIERPPLPLVPVPGDIRRLVKPSRRQRHTRLIGRIHHFRKRPRRALSDNHTIHKPRLRITQPIYNRSLDLVTRHLHRHPIQVRPARGRSCRSIWHLAGIGGGNLDCLKTNTKSVRSDLSHLLEQSLPHLRSTMVQMHRTILIHMHQGTRLIEMRQSKRNPKFHRRQTKTTLQDRLTRIPRIHRLAARSVSSSVLKVSNQPT